MSGRREFRPLVAIVAREHDEDGDPIRYTLKCGHKVKPKKATSREAEPDSARCDHCPVRFATYRG